MEKISVIVPVYNREQKIRKSIQSVIEQTYSNLEIIVVDDGSTDNTERVVKEIPDESIIYIKQPVNQGVSAARNAGVLNATADLIAFHDSDDYWYADKLEKQMDYWNKHPEYSMIYCGYWLKGMDDTVITVPFKGTRGNLEGNIYQTLLINNTIGAPTMLMRKDSFMKVGGFDTSLRSLEDWEFAIRYSKYNEIGYVREYLMDAYETPGSVSSNVGAAFETRCKIIADHRGEYMKMDLFDSIIQELFQRAEKAGCLELVKKLLMLYLSSC